MNKRAIKVDLSLFFGDERKMCWIFLDPNWKTVECLQRRIELLFDISSVCLLGDGCYLPLKEPIEIIKYCEVIKAFVLNESKEVRKKKKSKKLRETMEKSQSEEVWSETNNKLTNVDDVVTSTRAHIHDTSPISMHTNKLLEESSKEQDLSKISGNTSKKRKSANDVITISEFPSTLLDNSNFLDEFYGVHQLFNSKNSTNPSKKRKSVCQLVDHDIMTTTNLCETASCNLLNNTNTLEECTNSQKLCSSKNLKNSCKTEKSCKTTLNFVRVDDEMMSLTRLSKIASSTPFNESNLLEASRKIQQLPNSNNPFKKCKSGKAHIYFDETGDVLNAKSKKEKKSISKIDKKSGTIVVFRCPLNNDNAEPLKPRIFHLKSKNNTAKKLIEIQEDILIPPHSSLHATNETSSANEATMVNNVEKDAAETDVVHNHQNSLNSRTNQTENYKEVSFNNSNSEYQNEETNTNKTENESMATKEATETSNVHKTDVSCLSEATSEAQNETQTELSTSCIEGNESKIAKNNSQIDKDPADSQMELTDITDQPSELKNKTSTAEIDSNENSVMSVDYSNLNIEKDTTVTEPVHDHQTSLNSSTDCVDLSIDLEDDIKPQHNVSAEDECNISSSSDVEEVSEIIDLNESDYNCSGTTLNNSKHRNTPGKEIKVHKILPLSRDLTDLPGADDIIVFKVPYTTNRRYACTNFIAGKVEYINKRTKNIKVSVLDGFSELYHVPSNLFCNLDDSQEGVNKRLQLKLTDMVQPKLFSIS